MFKTNPIVKYRVRLRTMDLVSIIDNNKGKYCAQNNKYYFKYLTLFSITQPNSWITLRKNTYILFNVVIRPFTATGFINWTTLLPSMDCKQNRRKYTCICAVITTLRVKCKKKNPDGAPRFKSSHALAVLYINISGAQQAAAVLVGLFALSIDQISPYHFSCFFSQMYLRQFYLRYTYRF
jgi:hypothetical protein